MAEASRKYGRGCAVALVTLMALPIALLVWLTLADRENQRQSKPQDNLFSTEVLAYFKSGGPLKSDHHLFAGVETVCLLGPGRERVAKANNCPAAGTTKIALVSNGSCRIFALPDLDLPPPPADHPACRATKQGFRLQVITEGSKKIALMLKDVRPGNKKSGANRR